jgi:pimeloyl-ACP methyl ester carboxylesterase
VPIHTTADGCSLRYDIQGEGPPLVLTPGGREGRAVLASLAAELAKHFRVLTWDRRNTGESDLWFEPARSEQAIWAADLVELVGALDFGPAIVAGGSAGCRVSLNAVLRDPGFARALVLWSASGGAYGSQFLGFNYHVPYIVAAQAGGMAAVAETPFFAERLAANPANVDYLASFDPEEFIATMKVWNESFYPREGDALVGIEGELSSIRLPTLIFEGNDDIHPAEAALALAAAIDGARLVPSPWSGEEFMDVLTGKGVGAVFDLYPRLVPQILAFVKTLPHDGRSERN